MIDKDIETKLYNDSILMINNVQLNFSFGYKKEFHIHVQNPFLYGNY